MFEHRTIGTKKKSYLQVEYAAVRMLLTPRGFHLTDLILRWLLTERQSSAWQVDLPQLYWLILVACRTSAITRYKHQFRAVDAVHIAFLAASGRASLVGTVSCSR